MYVELSFLESPVKFQLNGFKMAACVGHLVKNSFSALVRLIVDLET